jgi:hypothetical protein
MMKTIGPELGSEHDQKMRDIAIAEQENDMVRQEACRKDLNRRSLRTIAREISADWCPISISAVPYLQAMRTMDSVRDDYGADSGQSIVLYFLGNAKGWRGETARRIKAELKGML